MTDREVMQQALDALESGLAFDTHSVVLQNLRTALAMHQVSEFAQAQEQQSEMRMPKVGDRVICLEDESLGTVASLTAGGSPDITFDDGSRGTYRLSEFAELFGYVAAQLDKTSFNVWWDSEYDDSENRFEKDSAAYWAWAGWQAAKRPWVGLTDEDVNRESAPTAKQMKLAFHAGMYVAQRILTEKNDH